MERDSLEKVVSGLIIILEHRDLARLCERAMHSRVDALVPDMHQLPGRTILPRETLLAD